MNKKNYTVGVVGLGYVGLPLAIFAKKKFKVIGFDIDPEKIKKLKKNISYLKRISKSQIKYIKNNNGLFSNNFEYIRECDCVIICVPTPLKKNKPDLSFIKNTIKQIFKYLRENQLVILESTSYPGTTRELIVEKINKKFEVGKNFFIGFSRKNKSRCK